MKDKENNVAYIDGANLHKGVESLIGFILSPYETKKCSILLKRTGVKISYITDQKNILKKDV